MRSISIIILFCIISCFLTFSEAAEYDQEHLAATTPAIEPGHANYSIYTPARDSSRAAEDLRERSMPNYLSSKSRREPARLGGRVSPSADLRGAIWSASWPYNQTLTQKGRFIPASEPVGIEEYHVPSIVEFLKPDWNPSGLNHSYYVPSLVEFANASWTPPQANYTLHVPSLGEFLSEEWHSQRPNPADYPLWMREYLRG